MDSGLYGEIVLNILVTGAAGFIGSHVVDQLLLENHHVTGLDNFDPFYDESLKRHNLESAQKKNNFKLIQALFKIVHSLSKSCYMTKNKAMRLKPLKNDQSQN